MYTKTDILSTVMPSEDTKILEFSQLWQSDEESFFYLCESSVFGIKDRWM